MAIFNSYVKLSEGTTILGTLIDLKTFFSQIGFIPSPWPKLGHWDEPNTVTFAKGTDQQPGLISPPVSMHLTGFHGKNQNISAKYQGV